MPFAPSRAAPAKEDLVSSLPALPPTIFSPSCELLDDEKKPESSHGASADAELGPDEYNPAIMGHPWQIKGPTLLLVLFLTRESYAPRCGDALTASTPSVGSYFASSSISPLKSTLKKELGIDNAQYANVGRFRSALSALADTLHHSWTRPTR